MCFTVNKEEESFIKNPVAAVVINYFVEFYITLSKLKLINTI